MPDTQQSVSAILALLADNTSQQISPQDLRNALVSWRPGHGELALLAADSAAVSITDSTNYFEANGPTWTLSAGGHWFDESAGNGRLTYIGAATVYAHIAATVSFSDAANDVLHWRIGLNGTTLPASEIQRKVSAGGDVGSSAMHVITSMSTGDYLSLWVRNASATDNPTLNVANLQAMTMPT